MSKRDDLADELVGYQIGEGYYSLDIGITEARQIADLVMEYIAEAWDEGYGAGKRAMVQLMSPTLFATEAVNPYK